MSKSKNNKREGNKSMNVVSTNIMFIEIIKHTQTNKQNKLQHIIHVSMFYDFFIEN